MDFAINCKFEYNRDDYILKICRNKKVLHIGACDAPYTSQKLENNLLLHTKLSQVSKKLLGIDINKNAINFLHQQGYNNIIYYNMDELGLLEFEAEVIVFGETIEHLTNLDSALENIKKIINDKCELLISTPNAFYIMNFFNSIRKKEVTHKDHKILFSYQTLKQLLESKSFKIIEAVYTFLNRENKGCKKRIFKRVISGFPVLAETLLFRCKG
jgi:2-polyprenyl-3-methyl-5-hydroxy-6-metoxy-1,4-benzoquinol methylase